MSINVSTPVVASVLSAAVAGVGLLIISRYWRQKKRLPEKWSRVGTLKELEIYPIKSCGGIKLLTAECTHMGLRDEWLRDRVLMVVTENANFVTARQYPQMVFVKPAVSGSVLTLTHPEMEPISVNLAEVEKTEKRMTATVWSVPVPVYNCGKEVSEWFTRLLKRNAPTDSPLYLVYYASQSCRPIKNPDAFYKFEKTDTGALPDESSYHLINESSVDDLNKRLADVKVSWRNFRPNFLLVGPKPYDEDNWKFLKIGDVIFEVLKPCGRCVMTTIDPETGTRNSNSQPLEALKSYRQAEEPGARKSLGSSPRLGLMLALRSPPGSCVALNDPIYVSY